MSQNVNLSKGQRVKVTVSPASKLTAKGAEFSVVSGDCTLEADEEDKTAQWIIASESVGQSIIKVSGKIHPKKEPGEGEEEGGEEEGGEEVSAAKRGDRERRPKPTPYGEGKEGEEVEEEEPETGEELIYVDVTDPNSSALGVNVGTPEDIEEEEEEEGGEGAAAEGEEKKKRKRTPKRKKPKK